MPELPEVQAHAERLTERFAGAQLERFVPFNFTVLKTAVPPPDAAYDWPLLDVGRRGKYLLIRFEPITFVVHLMQGGRLLVDEKQSPKPRNGRGRFVFTAGPALLLTEAGTERRAGVWCVANNAGRTPLGVDPLDRLGPDALALTVGELGQAFKARNMRLHGWLRDQHNVAGLGRMLANEICHRARISPFAMTAKLDDDAVRTVYQAIHDAADDGLAYERTRSDMSSSADRPGRVHGRIGESCDVCGDTIRSVTYSGYTVAYCPTCQTAGKVLADNTTSKFLR